MQLERINNQYSGNTFRALYFKNSGNWTLSRKIKFERNPEVCKLIRLFREMDMDLEGRITDSLEREIEIYAKNNENIINNDFVCKINSLKDFSAQDVFNGYKNQLIMKVLKCLSNRTTT